MNSTAALKILDILVHADIAYHLKGTSYREFLTPYYHRSMGELRKELGKILALGTDMHRFIDIFIQELNDE
jgi:hypothetical protein